MSLRAVRLAVGRDLQADWRRPGRQLALVLAPWLFGGLLAVGLTLARPDRPPLPEPTPPADRTWGVLTDRADLLEALAEPVPGWAVRTAPLDDDLPPPWTEALAAGQLEGVVVADVDGLRRLDQGHGTQVPAELSLWATEGADALTSALRPIRVVTRQTEAQRDRVQSTAVLWWFSLGAVGLLATVRSMKVEGTETAAVGRVLRTRMSRRAQGAATLLGAVVASALEALLLTAVLAVLAWLPASRSLLSHLGLSWLTRPFGPDLDLLPGWLVLYVLATAQVVGLTSALAWLTRDTRLAPFVQGFGSFALVVAGLGFFGWGGESSGASAVWLALPWLSLPLGAARIAEDPLWAVPITAWWLVQTALLWQLAITLRWWRDGRDRLGRWPTSAAHLRQLREIA